MIGKHAPLAVAVCADIAVFAVLLHEDFPHRDLWLASATTLLYGAAVLLLALSRLPARQMAIVVVVVGGLLQLVALTRSPLTSDDANRYVWDAKVQLHGIDPYRYVPSAPQLAHLRDTFLFGPSSSCAHPLPRGCTAINRPDVHTLYPPVAQTAFVIVRLASLGGRGEVFPYQLVAALGATAVSVMLARRALRLGTAIWPVALWAWCPVVVSEFGNNAHIDWLAVILSVAALQAGAIGRDRGAAILLAAAIATKLYPALLLPSLMRRRPWAVPLVAIGVVLLVYLPHLVVVGTDVVGYLPGYLQEEGYNSGSRLLLLGAVLPHPIDTAVGVVVLVIVAVWAWRRSNPDAPEQTATLMTGAAFLVTTPSYGWYAALLIALAVMSARYEWVILGITPMIVYLVRTGISQTVAFAEEIYAIGALLTLAAGAFRLWFVRRAVRRSRVVGKSASTAQ